ncbi:hypothetical protein KCU65_g4022, partial [Aureobasidium melanogenum]
MSDSESDISMSDAESESSGPPSIFIPDPPRLPALFKDDQGVVRPTRWHKHIHQFVARYNKDFTGFDVRQENGKDPMGDPMGDQDDEEGEEGDDGDEDKEEGNDDEDEDIQDADEWPYHLGPSTRCPGSSPVIATWGVQLLEAAGFINHEQDDFDTYMDPVGRWAKIRNPHNLEAERIHPVFRRDMFRNLTDVGYKLMLPIILLASAWLDEPTTLNFFYAVWATEQRTSFYDVELGHCAVVHVPRTLSEYNQRETHEKIVAMRRYTGWYVADASLFVDRGALACTGTIMDNKGNTIPASTPNTRQSQIAFSVSAIEILRLYGQYVSTGSQE